MPGPGKGAVAAEGLWGSSAPILAALSVERLNRPLLLVTAHADDADDIRDDIETALGSPPELLPQLDTLPQDAAAPDELAGERLRLCLALLAQRNVGTTQPPANPDAARSDAAPLLRIVAPIMALMQPVPSADAIAASSLSVAAGQPLDPERLARWLGEHGFQRCDAVDVPGDFARRGGIIDLYSNAHTDPVRIEFFGDEVSSIRLFDIGTQRSSHTLEALQIPALTFTADQAGPKATTSFLALLPPDTLIAFQEPTEIQELGRTYLERLGERAGIIPVEALFRRANDFTQLHLHRFTGVVPDAVRFDVASLPQFEPKAADALRALAELAETAEVVVLCDNPPEEQRFRELLEQERNAPSPPPRGRLGGGTNLTHPQPLPTR